MLRIWIGSLLNIRIEHHLKLLKAKVPWRPGFTCDITLKLFKIATSFISTLLSMIVQYLNTLCNTMSRGLSAIVITENWVYGVFSFEYLDNSK